MNASFNIAVIIVMMIGILISSIRTIYLTIQDGFLTLDLPIFLSFAGVALSLFILIIIGKFLFGR